MAIGYNEAVKDGGGNFVLNQIKLEIKRQRPRYSNAEIERLAIEFRKLKQSVSGTNIFNFLRLE